mmetsp:Transcript_93754/g.146366  ORF Transcript_93754/g.146366 Transcript_93754/m.146366 type:complete len:249 (+) Transcript_93754:52-798(+)
MGSSASCGGDCFIAFTRSLGTRYKPWIPKACPVDASKTHLAVEARIAARKSCHESLDIVSERLGKSLTDLDENGRTLLFYAVRGTRNDAGRLDPAGGTMASPKMQQFDPNCVAGGAAKHLVEKYGLDINYQVHDSGISALMEAVRYGNAPTTIALLQLGADPELRNAEGHTALDIARTKAPQYLNMNECQCSENHMDALAARVNQDRSEIAALLEEVQKLGGFSQYRDKVIQQSQVLGESKLPSIAGA